jgi:hypothetical protein
VQYRAANIGLVLEGLVVVDVDPRNGGDAAELPHRLPDTCTAKTGGGGWHHLFRANGARYPGQLAPGIDCKSGPGSYIVVEPSVHPSGAIYNWVDDTEPWNMQPAEAPAWLAEPQGNGKTREGTRNSTLTSIAGVLRREGMAPEAIEAALLAENAKRCNPPLAEDEVRRIARSVSRYEPAARAAVSSTIDPDAARVGDIFTVPPAPPRFTVEGFLPQNVGAEAAAGGLGKTTRHQCEHVLLVNGLPLYGRRILKPGAVLIVTKEDSREDLLYRYHMIASQMGLTEAQRRAVMEHIYVEDLSGAADRLALSEQGGNLVSTDLAEKIVLAYAGRGLALLDFDPINFFGPGERFVNDGEAKLMEIGRYIARELKCTVRYTAHVSKEAARGRYVDAHAGRGGAAGGDNARFVHVFVPHSKDDEQHYPMPSGVGQDVVAQRRLYRLHLAKVSGAPPVREPIWLIREGFVFRHVAGEPPSLAVRDEADMRRVQDFLAAELRRGVKHTQRTLEACRDTLELSRDRLRYVLVMGEQCGFFESIPLDAGEGRGGKQHYLAARWPRGGGENE